MYRKLKRTWSNGYMNYIPNFDKTFPELSHLGSEEMCDRLRSLGLNFYTEKLTPVKWWIRLTLPFALIVMLLMILFLPFNFLITGKWGYSLGEKNYILNWLRSLKLQ